MRARRFSRQTRSFFVRHGAELAAGYMFLTFILFLAVPPERAARIEDQAAAPLWTGILLLSGFTAMMTLLAWPTKGTSEVRMRMEFR